ncbi:MAG: hypothetical protein ACREBS_00575 [Nitrososphaerales archaeon]
MYRAICAFNGSGSGLSVTLKRGKGHTYRSKTDLLPVISQRLKGVLFKNLPFEKLIAN